MEDNLNHDEFEEFLQDQVRNHRMYPSDAVWREIDKSLHGEKRWPALTIAAALLVSATVLICVYFTPKSDIFSITTANVNTSTNQVSQKDNILNNLNSSVPFNKAKPAAGLVENDVNKSGAVSPLVDQSISEQAGVKLPIVRNLKNSTAAVTRNQNGASLKLISGKNVEPGKQLAEAGKVAAIENNEISKEVEISTLTETNTQTRLNQATTVDDAPAKTNIDNKIGLEGDEYKGDLAIYNLPKRANPKHKFSYQIYVAPSVSYRKLLEDNSMLKENSGGPVGLNYITDVNKVVRHRPGTGIEAGVSFMYNLSSKVRVKSGFQFNMRQYSIEAYRSNTELASIALVGNNRLDTINTLAIYRTNNGYYSAKLVNRYYQLSAPLGIEWEVLGNKLIQLNVAGTIQPTYLLNRNAYLLSTNFKNYTESPGMIRQWNINSNIEAFISLKAGDFKWQLGPQLRYQPYSTFIPEYSIKEHLMDYGIKLGVSKTLGR